MKPQIKYTIAVVTSKSHSFFTWCNERLRDNDSYIPIMTKKLIISGEFKYKLVINSSNLRGERIDGVIYLHDAFSNPEIDNIEENLHYSLIG